MSDYQNLVIKLQKRIDLIVNEAPPLFSRLKLVLQNDPILDVLVGEPSCPMLAQMFVGNTPDELFDPGFANFDDVLPTTVVYKRKQFQYLKKEVHLDYLNAGANIIISASYQATLQGFQDKGLSVAEAEALLIKSVEIAREARDIYNDRCTKGSFDGNDSAVDVKRRPTLVAASVGSYGAYLADGSEYSGDYGESVTLETLKDFHRRRVQVLAGSGADLIAFETIPNKLEAQAYAEILQEEDIKITVWFSFSSKDGVNVVSGDSILECAAIANSCKYVAAVGINCTPPRYIHDLISAIKKATDKPIVIYPNSGETYDGISKQWMKTTGETDDDFVSYVRKWHEAGASLVGGCCRTTPNTIRAIAQTLAVKVSQLN